MPLGCPPSRCRYCRTFHVWLPACQLGSCRLTGEGGRRELVESDVMEQRRRAGGGRRNPALGNKCRNQAPNGLDSAGWAG